MRRQTGESVVLIGAEPAALAYLPLMDQPFRVRSTYLIDTGTVEYVAGRDFRVDSKTGTLWRTPGSRLPDYRRNSLFGKEQFDHQKFPGFGNDGFFAYVDYAYVRTNDWPVQPSQTNRLQATLAKLQRGQTLKLVAFGDSITAGYNVSRPALIFWQRWTDELQRKYPQARITAVNGATAGDTTRKGCQRLAVKVIAEKPDLVLIGFGMNDHNVGGVPVPEFQTNLQTMVAAIRAQTGAEVILYSALPPNPRWKYSSHRMADYAAATAAAAESAGCAYADVYANWQALAARKQPEDLLGNNVNHPNDFGHWIYLSVFEKLGL